MLEFRIGSARWRSASTSAGEASPTALVADKSVTPPRYFVSSGAASRFHAMPKQGLLEQRIARLESVFGDLMPTSGTQHCTIIERMAQLHNDHKDMGNTFLRSVANHKRDLQEGVEAAVSRVQRSEERARKTAQGIEAEIRKAEVRIAKAADAVEARISKATEGVQEVVRAFEERSEAMRDMVQSMLNRLKSRQKSTQKTLVELERHIRSADENASSTFAELMGAREELVSRVDGVWKAVEALEMEMKSTRRQTAGLELMTVAGLNSFRERSRERESTRGRSDRRPCDLDSGSRHHDRARSNSADREALQAKARASSADGHSMRHLIREAQRIAHNEREAERMARTERVSLNECD